MGWERRQNDAGGDGKGGFRMVRKSRCMSGSLDRPRGHSRLRSTTKTSSSSPRRPVQRLSTTDLPLRSSLQTAFLSSGPYLALAIMGAIPEADPDEPQATQPFKFVTGKLASSIGPATPLPKVLWIQWPSNGCNC